MKDVHPELTILISSSRILITQTTWSTYPVFVVAVALPVGIDQPVVLVAIVALTVCISS